ncbi:MAG: MgtC/SapB family protein [Deltaproteobacteria bacterium]|nr:MgtC/SapB family protein [Deltaproteobacteria bacterium]
MTHAMMLTRIALGAAFGATIGYERDRHRRTVGLRTHCLVGLASATFMVVSAQFAFAQGYGADWHVEVDASRIAASVVTGVGFLAGGAILRSGPTVLGLTTAAGLWLVSAIGLCAGAGMFWEAGTVTAVGLAVMTIMRRLQDKDNDAVHLVVHVRSAGLRPGDVSAAIEALGHGSTIRAWEVDHHADPGAVTASLDVKVPHGADGSDVLDAIAALAGVRSVALERLTRAP